MSCKFEVCKRASNERMHDSLCASFRVETKLKRLINILSLVGRETSVEDGESTQKCSYTRRAQKCSCTRHTLSLNRLLVLEVSARDACENKRTD